MTRPPVRELGRGRLMVDLGFRDTEGLVASYLIPGPSGWTVVETGPTTCRGALLEGLDAAGVDHDRVARVFVSHIHLDHAGGLGRISTDLPNARLFAHRQGTPHLVDPTRLVVSARRAWGPAADPLWGTIVPVPGDRLEPLDGGERFEVEGGTFHIIATPGHANHHLAFFDSATRGLLTGDAAGVRLEGSWRPRPAVPPPEADLELLFASLDRMAEFDPKTVWYTHFGPVEGALDELTAYRTAVTGWRDAALAQARQDPSVAAVARTLREFETRGAKVAGASGVPEAKEGLISGYDLAAQGLLRYFRLHGDLSE